MSGYSCRQRGRCPFTSGNLIFERTPERLVGLGFRHWIAGFQTGEVGHWERAWNVYEASLGEQGARLALSELSSWAKTLKACSRRELCVHPCAYRSFCRDECLAVAMVAASQHNVCPALKSCSLALIESQMHGEVVAATESYGAVLRSLGQMLTPEATRLADIVGTPGALH